MIFAIKRRLVPTLALLALLAGVSLALRHFLDYSWNLRWDESTVFQIFASLAVIGASDAILHGGFCLAFKDRYLASYRAIVTYFRMQGRREIAAAGLLAGFGEEMLFRGVVLEGIDNDLGWGPAAGVAVSAVMFGALHWIPQRRLVPFALWAVWEGVLLGGVYVVTGSLLVSMAVHGLHDSVGFTLFAYQRQTGWLLGNQITTDR